MTLNPATIISLAAFCLYVTLLTIAILRHGVRERTTAFLEVYLLAAAVWSLANILIHVGDTDIWRAFIYQKIVAYGTIGLPLIFCGFTIAFLRKESRAFLWWSLGWVLVAAVVVIDLDVFNWGDTLWLAQGQSVARQDVGYYLAVVCWTLFSGLSLLIAADQFRRTARPLHRNRLRYLILAIVLTVVGDGLYFGQLNPYDQVGLGLKALSITLASYAVLSYHLADVKTVVRKIISYSIITFITVLFYLSGIFVAEYIFQSGPSHYTTILGIGVVALVLAVVYQPMREFTLHLTNRFLFGQRVDYEQILRDYSQSISNILDLERLAEVAVGIIGEALRVQRGMLLLVRENDEGVRLQPIEGMGTIVPPPTTSTWDSPVMFHLQDVGRPLTQFEIDLQPQFNSLAAAEREWLQSLDMDVYVPIFAQGSLIGILALGSKTSGDSYSNQELDLLNTLADQTAVALENARLFDDLKRLNAEITHLNQHLDATNQKLERLDKTKSDFINIASHELKTPLTLIHGYANLLVDMGDEELNNQKQLKEIVQGIAKGTSRLQQIIDAMLDVSMIDADVLALHLTTMPLARPLRTAISRLQPAIKERQQIVTIAGVDDMPEIEADEQRLFQAFFNVIGNSMKYTPDGGRIDITAQLVGNGFLEERFVEVVIADTGIGINPEDKEHIFDKFYRVGDPSLHSTSDTKFKGGGPGLGLPIARGIIEAHGGKIWVESECQDEERCPGSEFHIVLPVRMAETERKKKMENLAKLGSFATETTVGQVGGGYGA